MGILRNFFKSILGVGGGDEEATPKPAEAEKPAAAPSPAVSSPSQAAKVEKSPTSEVKKAEPTSKPTPAKVEPRPVEKPVTTAPTPQRAEPSQAEIVAKHPTSEAAMKPEVAAKPAEVITPVPNLVSSPAPQPEIAPAMAIAASSVAALPTEKAVESGGSFLDEVVDDFDVAFDAAFNVGNDNGQVATGVGDVRHDEEAIRDLFAKIAANYARPVKNFIFELKRGTATKEWIEICRPALRSISRAAESMDLATAAKKMVDFDEALSLAQSSEDRVLGGEIRDLILSSYDELVEVMAEAFVVGEEEQQREGIIINSLLKQIPDLGRVTFEKLYGAGLTSFDTLFLAKKEDLGAATGIPLWLCERICNKFQEYREELEGTPRDVAQSSYRSKLAELVEDLRRQHEGFEQASAQEWSNPALASDKRKFRQNRQACVLQINVVLAEMGELDLVNEIQKLSFDRRIQRLEEYLQSTEGVI
jgi:hypothetical protein